MSSSPGGSLACKREVGETVASDRDRVGMVARREAGLGACEVERHDRLVVAATPHAELRDLARARRGAHRADDRPHGDGVARRGCLMLPVAEPALHRVDDLVEGQAALLMQLGCEAHLRVHDPVGGEVERGLARDSVQRRLGLHHGQGVLERCEVLEDVARVGAPREPLGELVHVGRGQIFVAHRIRELDDRPRPQPAVEMIV